MATVAETNTRLRETDGFVVESPDGDLGWVEEVWVGEANEPAALAVRTADGRHGLLLGEDVLAVDRENRWVVVPPEPDLLELDVPRLTTMHEEGAAIRLAASWATTGALLPVSPRRHRRSRFPSRPSEATRPMPTESLERPLWQPVGVLIASLVLIVAFAITLAFVIARLVTGAAY
ncbi:MAG TPA: hypothetical protein VFR38_16240 [Gaiellaceae bacterium]|nr:hypothetical protein [Gaiellaceae bacterium]